MTSLTRTAQGVVVARRHGRSRAAASYQVWTASANESFMLRRSSHAPCTLGPSIAGMGVNAVLQPVGPQPARVYWARRAVVVALLVVLLIGIAHVLGGGGSSTPQAAGGPTPTPTSTASATPTTSGRPPVCHHA